MLRETSVSHVILYDKQTSWTNKECAVAKAVLQKIAHCQNQSADLPGEVFEAHLRSKKNISTNVAIFNDNGQVYLIQRPSLKEYCDEPYPNLWHFPGVTHLGGELYSETLIRLSRKELGGVYFRDVHAAGQRDSIVNKRGLYIHILVITRTTSNPNNSKGMFYTPNELLHRFDMIHYHRTVFLPLFLERARSFGWVS